MRTARKMWLCSLCGEPFQHCLKRLQHRRVHSIFRPYICYDGTCTKLFSTLSAFQVHRRYHADQRLYSCRKCGLKFLSRNHHRLHNCKARTYKCNICFERFLHLLPLKYHYKTRHDNHEQKLSLRERKKLNVKIKLKKNHSALDESECHSIKNSTKDICDKDGKKILLKITAGRSTTIISPKREVSDKKCTNKQSKKKSKKKERKSEKEKTRNGIILSFKNRSLNLPQSKQSYVCKRVNGLPNDQEVVKHVTDLKLKIKTYPNLTVKQSDERKTLSSDLTVPSLHNKSEAERTSKDTEKLNSQIHLDDDVPQSFNSGESKIRNGIVIVKDKSGRLQAEQLQAAKLRKRDRDNVFDSFSDIGVWKVMPSPRTDNPSDALKLRLSPQKPLRLDQGSDSTFESASARYLDVALKTKVFNSGYDSDMYDASSVVDKDSENGGQGVNDSGIEVLSSSTIRSNGNSVRSVALDESSPNYLNTEDSLLSLDSPIADTLCRTEHSLCHKCGGIIVETNNNTRSPGRCRCFVSNPNSPFQTPLSPVKMNLAEPSDKSYQENKKKLMFPEQGKYLEIEKAADMKLSGQSSQVDKSYRQETIDSDGSDVLIPVNDSEMSKSIVKTSFDETEGEDKSLCLKIQLGDNPSASPVKKTECRKLTPDKRVNEQLNEKPQTSTEKLQTFKDVLIQNVVENADKGISSSSNSSDLNRSCTVDIANDEDVTLEELRKSFPKGLASSKDLLNKDDAKSAGCNFSDNVESGVSDNLESGMEKVPLETLKVTGCDVSDSVESGIEKVPLETLKVTGCDVSDSVESGIEKVPLETLGSNDNGEEVNKNKVEPREIKEKLEKVACVQEECLAIPEVPVIQNDNEVLPTNESMETNVKTVKRKPLFKSAKLAHGKTQVTDSAIGEIETPPADKEQLVKNKKQVQKKRTRNNSTCEVNKSKRKPIFKRALSVGEHKHFPVDDSQLGFQDKTPNCSIVEKKSLFEKFDRSDISVTENKTAIKNDKKILETKENLDLALRKQTNIRDKLKFSGTRLARNGTVVNETIVMKSDSEVCMTEDSLQAIPTVDLEEVSPLSPSESQKDVVSPLNPFQQQFLSFLSSTKLPDSKFLNKNAKTVKKADKEKMDKDDKKTDKDDRKIDKDDKKIDKDDKKTDKDDRKIDKDDKKIDKDDRKIDKDNRKIGKDDRKMDKDDRKTDKDDRKIDKDDICTIKTEVNLSVKPAENILKEKEAENILKEKENCVSEEKQTKSDSVSWLNIFSQINPDQNETRVISKSESKDDIGDFNEDLAAITEKMDTKEDEDSDSLDVDEIFESKNLSSLQPLQSPKDILSSQSKLHSGERRKSTHKRRREQNHSDSEYSANSSDGDTIDLYCCHKNRDPEFNPYMDSDDDFMPSKPLRRRKSAVRRAKKSRSMESMSSENDFRNTRDNKSEDRSETGSQISRSRRSKQGIKSCCPCCIGSFGDFEDDHLMRKPPYKLPKNHKQFVRSTLRLMQLQEKIHRLFISLFPGCIDLISRVKLGTEEFEMLIEDILYGLESQEVEFEPACDVSHPVGCTSPTHSQAGFCHYEASCTSMSTTNQLDTPESLYSSKAQTETQGQGGTDCADVRKSIITDHLQRSNSIDLKNQNILDDASEKLKSGDFENGLSNSGHLGFAENVDRNKCKMVPDSSETVASLTLNSNTETAGIEMVEQKSSGFSKLSTSQDSCLTLSDNDSQLIPVDNRQSMSMADDVSEDKHHTIMDDMNGSTIDDDAFVDENSGVQSHLQITIDLSAARVSVCREPKHCLTRLHGQLVKLVKCLVPELDLKNYFYRNIDNIEYLIDLMIASNSNPVSAEAECVKIDSGVSSAADLDEVKSETEILVHIEQKETPVETVSKIDSNSDTELPGPEDIKSKTSSIAEVDERIPFEQRIKSQRESLKKDVFQFEEDDTAAMIKKSESVLSNIETLSNIAKRTTRTKSRETRLRKRTAEEKRTLFVQEKIQNNSTIICHKKTKPPPASKVEHKSKCLENSKHKFLSELNLGDKHGLPSHDCGESKVEEEVKSSCDLPLSDKNEGDDIESENRRKSSDKNIFELMQPTQAAESAL